eukprot:c20998_g3_i1 orf=1032-1316(+)
MSMPRRSRMYKSLCDQTTCSTSHKRCSMHLVQVSASFTLKERPQFIVRIYLWRCCFQEYPTGVTPKQEREEMMMFLPMCVYCGSVASLLLSSLA